MKKDEERRKKSFTRRALFVGALQGTILGVLGGRLAWLQLAQGQRYKTLADNNRINVKMLAPSRGRILDRAGVPLAINDQNFRVIIIPEQTGNLETALSRLQKLVELSQNDIRRVLTQARRNPAFVPLEVRDNLKWEDVSKIEVNLPDLPGVSIDVGQIRTYPYNDVTAHLVGYVGAVSRADLDSGDPMMRLPGLRVGRTGAERAFETLLRGKSGTAQVEVNAVGREVRELRRQPPHEGADINLTVDADLQIYTQQRLATERCASAVIMDVHKGTVYALASHPGFDPNLFTRGLPAEQWEKMSSDPGLPLNNRAVGGQYPPGSTFKMITLLAALEEGLVNRNTRYFCPGHYDFGDDRFHCWRRGGHGHVNAITALSESCDVYYYKLATEIGINKLAAYATMFGLGHRLGVELDEERPGLMPTREWKRGHIGQAWQPGETIVASIGQGYILSTPLQLATMTARLVNGGYAVTPHLLAAAGGQKTVHPETFPKIPVKSAHLDIVMQGMNETVLGRRGTAYGSRIETESMGMGGKTGTSQVRRITRQQREEGYRGEDLPWNHRHHALFVGYAPYQNPRYSCAVVVEHGGSGSAAAAPIVRDLLTRAQEIDPASQPLVIERSEAAPMPARPEESSL